MMGWSYQWNLPSVFVKAILTVGNSPPLYVWPHPFFSISNNGEVMESLDLPKIIMYLWCFASLHKMGIYAFPTMAHFYSQTIGMTIFPTMEIIIFFLWLSIWKGVIDDHVIFFSVFVEPHILSTQSGQQTVVFNHVRFWNKLFANEMNMHHYSNTVKCHFLMKFSWH